MVLKLDYTPTPTALVEVVSSTTLKGHEFCHADLREIGEFTRENVLAWLNAQVGGWHWEHVGIVEDFHAVCGDIDIPWATKEAAVLWQKTKSTRMAQS